LTIALQVRIVKCRKAITPPAHADQAVVVENLLQRTGQLRLDTQLPLPWWERIEARRAALEFLQRYVIIIHLSGTNSLGTPSFPTLSPETLKNTVQIFDTTC